MVTASLRLYRSIKQDIISCDLRPGTSFSEGEMCHRYKASRTPVREACRRLEKEGLIKIIPFRGYFVAPLTVSEFHSLHEIQLIIDTAAAAWAAKRASPEQVKTIEQLADYEYHLGVPASYATFVQRNLDLHVGIARATGNEHLAEIVNDVHTRLMRFYYLLSFA
jgi:DNA-binding GntR family transcriptional regulator